VPATFFSMLHDLSADHSGDCSAAGLATTPHDRGTAQHSSRVGQGAALVASRLGLDAHEVDVVAWAGILHDIGKLQVPDAVIYKPGPLTEDDWAQIKRHPEIGSDMLVSFSPSLAPIAAGVRSHHERWDGGGYPDGLRGTEIPLAGRIVAVLDVFDSLTSDRPYRLRSWTEEAVVEHIRTSAGTHLDTDVVAVFLELNAAGAARRVG